MNGSSGMDFISSCDPVNISDKTICLSVLLLGQHMRNGTIQSGTVNRNDINVRYNSISVFLWDEAMIATNLCVVTSNHFTIGNLLAHTIGRFIGIDRHIENITRMRCCMAGCLCFRLFCFCCFLHCTTTQLKQMN